LLSSHEHCSLTLVRYIEAQGAEKHEVVMRLLAEAVEKVDHRKTLNSLMRMKETPFDGMTPDRCDGAGSGAVVASCSSPGAALRDLFRIASLAAFKHAPFGRITTRPHHRSMVPIRKTLATLAWIGINYLLPNAY
jgi:hypothetical protein